MIAQYEIEMLGQAYKEALESPDPSTQNGAIFVSRKFETVGACNTYPTGVKVTPERMERPLKYSYIEHAERNAIYSAARLGLNTNGGTLICPWFACHDCGRAIIQSGIKRVVGHAKMFDATPEHWKDSITIAFTMFEEAGIITELYKGPIETDTPIRFNGELWSPES